MNFEQKRNFNKLVKDKESTMLNLYKMSVICKNIININIYEYYYFI